MEEKVKALLGKAREDRYILRGLKHLAVRSRDYELGAHLRDLEKSVFGDTPYDIPPPVREYKTWTNWPESKFDEDVAKLISEGWTLDSRHFGINDEGPLLCAFLSREVPSSPPAAEKPKIPRSYTANDIGLAWKAGRESHHARVDEWDGFIVEFLKSLDNSTLDPTEKQRGYTFDEMWLAYHKGWDFGYARKSTLDSDALFEEFLDSLGKKSPSQAEGRELPPREPHPVHSHPKWAAFLEGSTWNSFPAPEKSAEQHFMDWLETIPADPLEADRQLVAKYSEYVDWTTPILAVDGDDADLNELPYKLDASLSKLCGLEVSNG